MRRALDALRTEDLDQQWGGYGGVRQSDEGVRVYGNREADPFE